MLRAILNKSWRQHSTKQRLYGHLPPITKTIQVRRTRHAWHCWRRKDELISDILLWTPSHGRAKVGRPAWNDIQQLYADTGFSLEDQPRAMDDRDGRRKRFREIWQRDMMIMMVIRLNQVLTSQFKFRISFMQTDLILFRQNTYLEHKISCANIVSNSFFCWFPKLRILAQSAGAVEYTDCFSAEG